MQTPDRLHGTPSLHTLCLFSCVALTLLSVSYTMHLHCELARTKDRLQSIEARQSESDYASKFGAKVVLRQDGKPAVSVADVEPVTDVEDEIQAVREEAAEVLAPVTESESPFVSVTAEPVETEDVPIAAMPSGPRESVTALTHEEPDTTAVEVVEATAQIPVPAESTSAEESTEPSTGLELAGDLNEEETSLAEAMALGTTHREPVVSSSLPTTSTTASAPVSTGRLTTTVSTAMPGGAVAEILSANPAQQRVAISRGFASGIEKDERFVVYRNRQYVGDIRVVKTYSDVSICEIITPTPKGIRMGDLIRKAD